MDMTMSYSGLTMYAIVQINNMPLERVIAS